MSKKGMLTTNDRKMYSERMLSLMRSYPKPVVLIAAIAAAAVFLSVLLLPAEAAKAPEDFPASSPAGENSYIVRSYDGCIGVFVASDEQEPVSVISVAFESLREVDRDMLDSGVTVTSYEAVLRLLEDFTS